MYSKDQASQLKQTFWTTFGQYIAPIHSAEGLKINWVNYKTGVRHLHFKMEANKHTAFIAIEITHPDQGIQRLIFEQLIAFKKIMEDLIGEEWNWHLHIPDDNGKIVTRIEKNIAGVSVFNKEDWPTLISFFKPRIIALDEFWSDARYNFDMFK